MTITRLYRGSLISCGVEMTKEKGKKVTVTYIQGHGFEFTSHGKPIKTPQVMDYIEAHNRYMLYFKDNFKEIKEALARADELRILENLPDDSIEPHVKHLIDVINELYSLDMIRAEARQMVLREMLERTLEVLIDYPAEDDLLKEFASALIFMIKHNMQMSHVANQLRSEGFDDDKVLETMTDLQKVMVEEAKEKHMREHDGS